MLKQGHGPVLSACSSASTTKSSGLCPEHEAYVRESPSYEGLGFREGPTSKNIEETSGKEHGSSNGNWLFTVVSRVWGLYAE